MLKWVSVSSSCVARTQSGTTPKNYIGEEFEVVYHEGPSYLKDGGTVRVQKCGDNSVAFWCNHKDLGWAKAKPAAKKPLKVGDKVIVKAQPEGFMPPVGTAGEVTAVADSAPEYAVEAQGDFWCYTRDQLKRVKERAPSGALSDASSISRS